MSTSEGRFAVRVRPGIYRIVVDFGTKDESGKTTVEQVIRVEPDGVVEVELFQSVLVP